MAEKILLVDDEKDLVDLVAYNLEKAGYRTLRAHDGAAALRKLAAEGADAVVLDVMLPELDGWEVLKRLRSDPKSAKLPVLMLTARGEESDKVLGLELGADDYLSKPFSPRELTARVRALLRRAKPGPVAEAVGPALRFEGLEIDPSSREVRVRRKAVELTAREFELLAWLAARPGRVLTREILLEELWKMDPDVETRTVDVHVRRLRQKLGALADCIKTVRGVGYKFTAPGKA